MDKQISFSECSMGVKVGIIGGWAAIILYAIAFIYGFIGGLM